MQVSRPLSAPGTSLRRVGVLHDSHLLHNYLQLLSGYLLPKTRFSCSATRMKVVRLVNSFKRSAPT
ncbi:hypothetical protein FHU10_1095 [Serratia fonticola]|uniref:Uncharacterized protein n=1 Tax=Serratia fonticola TaxID=47917 RepID=A0A559T207_SERFO|nr:hypothetical protein FHU09_1353 [Serratia fonticola]TQI99118.1 hypothetical protein FHU11_4696 [Serratia fonticola]TVZ68643.1 hypothetical protein FHU10_1095 [Serratia fonticola]